MARYDETDVLTALAFGDFGREALEAAREIAAARIENIDLRIENAALKGRLDDEAGRCAHGLAR